MSNLQMYQWGGLVQKCQGLSESEKNINIGFILKKKQKITKKLNNIKLLF